MYQRNAKAELLKKEPNSTFFKELGISINDELVTMEDLQQLANLLPNDFFYDNGGLYSADKKIAYGYATDGDSVWGLPDCVEIYDNLFLYTYSTLRDIYIGEHLRLIVDTYRCFGNNLKHIEVAQENPFFTSINGCLYSKDEKEFLLYPPKYTRNTFSMCEGTEVIKTNAIIVSLLPAKFVIANSVKTLEKNWLEERYDKGFSWTKEMILEATTLVVPKHLQSSIEDVWKNDTYTRPTILYK